MLQRFSSASFSFNPIPPGHFRALDIPTILSSEITIDLKFYVALVHDERAKF